MVDSDLKLQRNITEYLKTKEAGNDFMQELLKFKDSMFKTKKDFTTDNFLALNRKYSAIIGKDITPSSEDSLGYIEKLIHWVEGCELVNIVLAFKPTDAFTENLYNVMSPKILRPFLLDIKVETTMIGGVQFTINGKYFDFSLDGQLSSYFSTHKDAVISELQK